MATGKNLFTGKRITAADGVTPSAALPVGKVDFVSVGVQVTEVVGNVATATFGVQWSFDGDLWTSAEDDPADVIGVFTAAGYKIKRMPVKAPYWRVVATSVTGTVIATSNAMVWND